MDNRMLDDIRETIIDDRKSIGCKIRIQEKNPGRTLGVSKTGSITYIQPESVVKHQFRLRENEEEEKKK